MREKVLAVLVGSMLLAIGVNGFLVPHHLLDGGVVGLGLIIHYILGWPAGLTILLLSLPLYSLAWVFDKRYFFHSLLGLLFSSFFIDLFSYIDMNLSLNIFLSSIIGGILVGCGIGLMLRYEMSTGGTDLLAQLLGKIILVNLGILIFVIDGIVILAGLPVVGLEKFIYSFITIIFVGLMTSACVTRPFLK